MVMTIAGFVVMYGLALEAPTALLSLSCKRSIENFYGLETVVNNFASESLHVFTIKP